MTDLIVILGVLAVPLGLVALAISFDRRSGRGYGLGVLAAASIILDIWLTALYFQASAASSASHTDNLDFIAVIIVYFLATFCPALAIVIGGVAEAFIARQWGWLAIIAAGALVPTALVLLIGGALIPDFPAALGLSRNGELVAWLFLPLLITLIYAIARIIRPVAPVAAAQVALP